MKKVIKIATLSLLVLLSGCKQDDLNTQYSNTTGWKYNDKKTTKFEAIDMVGMETPPGMIPIQGGTFMVGERGEFVTAPRNNKQRNLTVSSFYMDKYEVTNINWREYLHWMEIVFQATAPNLVKAATPDFTVWREELAYNEPYLENYFTHPAFNFYPVVGVTWEQAVDYCVWRTDRVNEMILVSNGIISLPDFASIQQPKKEKKAAGDEEEEEEVVEEEEEEGEETAASVNKATYEYIRDNFVFNTQKYLNNDEYLPEDGRHPKHDFSDNVRKVRPDDGLLVVGYRLPTEAEWEFAAYAPIASEEGLTIEGKIYPWDGYYPRSLSKKQLGQLQANFVRGRGDMMGVSGVLNDGYVITGPVNAFQPNDFGLYNMAGNVNEWVMDVYRETSSAEVAEYNSFRGNVYTTPKLDVEATQEAGEDRYSLDSLGRLAFDIASPDMDKRDFRDGDWASTIKTDYLMNFPADTTGFFNLTQEKLDPTDVLAPQITNRSRVYKGGSWKDRVYWLNPSSRRYLDQDKCTSTIGFRCAMSTVGQQLPGGTKDF
ncbi:MAG: SUMF1/EgtB/PvdO family nonheme iron enzyme [Paludibacteraceae bacterium]|nr:SUMF1/EgtB/PvdO family nonheme iron enzyme [Paludibacteraceae bacterium]